MRYVSDNRRIPLAATLPLFGFLALSLFSSTASAQVSRLDKGKLIDALQREGMSELLLHLVEVEPPKDPVEAQLITIAQLRLKVDELTAQAQDAAADPATREQLLAQRNQRFEELLTAWQTLITSHNDHEQRPIWQTDFAELLIDTYLLGIHLNACEFYDLGVPTKEQRAAFERAIPLALENLIDADQRFYDLSNVLPREANHSERINSGLWARMTEEYYGFRTPYYLGQVAYYAALLPDDHAYYQALGKNPKLPFQAKTAGEEKTRLLDLCLSKYQPIAEDPSNRRETAKLIAQAFRGRAMIKRGQAAEAIAVLDGVINANKGDLTHLVANLAKGRAMAAAGQGLAAMDHLTRVEFHPLAQQSLYVGLLVVDQEHQVLLKLTPDSAYDPYLNFLADKSLSEEQKAGLRLTIYNRWAASIPDGADLSKQPPVVLAAIGELARIEGQGLWNEARIANESGRTQDAEQLYQQADARFDRAVRTLETLLKRDNLDSKVLAKGQYNLAYAKYFKDAADPNNLLVVAKLWTDMAEANPEAPEAVDAVGNAVVALAPIFESGVGPPGTRDAFVRAAELLFEKFPQSPQAHNVRVFYGFKVLLPAGEYAKAAELFKGVPPGHPGYADARREWVLALQQAYEHAEPAQQNQARTEAIDAARFVLQELDQVMLGALPSDRPGLEDAKGWVTLALFDLLLAAGQNGEAMQIIDGFEKTYAGNPVLVQGFYERRIIQLAKAGQRQELEATARDMMLLSPDDAAPVINGVLGKLEAEIDGLRERAADPKNIADRGELMTAASDRAQTASTLAQLLLEWAQKQGFDEERMLEYQLPYVRALRIAGKPDDALAIVRDIAAKEMFQTNPLVIHEYAEALYAKGYQDGQVVDKNLLISAAKQYNDLIYGFSQGPFPPVFWNAWMRWMQIADALGEATGGIPQKIKELSVIDPNLGGEPYRDELRRLEIKYAATAR